MLFWAFTAFSASAATLVADWRMDEMFWNGAVGEVEDSVAANNGQAINGAVIGAGKICNGGQFDGTTNRHVLLPASVQGLVMPDNFTMSVWVKPGRTHEIDAQSSNSTTGISGQNYALFPSLSSLWNWDTGGYAGAGISVGTNGISVYEHAGGYMPPVLVWAGAVSAAAWTHVAVVYSGGVPALYVNGVFKASGVAGTNPNHLNVVPTFYAGSPVYGNYQGGVDEYQIFSGALSAAEIATGYANEAAANNWDGSVRSCPVPPQPRALYHLEESSWSGTSGEVKDSSGNNRHGTTIGSPLPATANITPALTGSPGTCGYGGFPGPANNGGVLTLPVIESLNCCK